MKISLSRLLVVLLSLVMTSSATAQTSEFAPPVTKTSSGIILIGWRPKVRAISGFSGSASNGVGYARVVNRYKELVGDSVNVYCMTIPTAAAYYTPSEPKGLSKSELPAFDSIRTNLSPEIHFVDVYSALLPHVSEAIYSRTDHHWSPLGAYYAAMEFARIADVPFNDLSHYDTLTVHNFVGSMYHYSKSPSVKQSPEDFIFYTPRDVEYSTTATKYTLVKDRISSSSYLDPAPFFYHYDDGSSAAYCTFIGGDRNNTKVVTSTHNGRRLLILKDSYGNALPGYLFYSFEEICIVDCRYFDKNMKSYIEDNKITDIVFANNLGHACTPKTHNTYLRYLTQ